MACAETLASSSKLSALTCARRPPKKACCLPKQSRLKSQISGHKKIYMDTSIIDTSIVQLIHPIIKWQGAKPRTPAKTKASRKLIFQDAFFHLVIQDLCMSACSRVPFWIQSLHRCQCQCRIFIPCLLA